MELSKTAEPRDCLLSQCRLVSRRTLFSVCVTCGLLLAGVAQGADYFAAPDGTNRGDGSIQQPWNLGWALKGPPPVQPGDTIWLRGGVYRAFDRPFKFTSSLSGAENLPITVRQYPGERAIVDGNITQTTGGWVNYWGFEIMNSLKRRSTPETGPFPQAFWTPDGRGNTTDFAASGFDLRAPQVKLINMLIHDSIGGGIVISTDAINPEVYGTLSFHNGWQGGDRGHGHGLYAQGVAPSVAHIRDNVFFSNYALGAQATGTGPLVDNFIFEGNSFFFNSVLSRQHQGNLVLGPFAGQARNISLLRNSFYQPNPSNTDVNIGYTGGISNGIVQGNYFATKVSFSPQNENVQVIDNTTLDVRNPGQEPNRVEVRPNQYEPGRAHIIVYNWEGLSTVTADLGNVLAAGTTFEIRSAQDILGAPVIRDIYAGGEVTLPMTGLSVSKSLLADPTPSTSPRFNVFVVLPQSEAATSTNTPPSLTGIQDQVTPQNKPTAPIRFRAFDAELLPGFLNISVSSSNAKLVPTRNIQFDGNGVTRTMTIQPARGRVGTSTITLTVSDGLLSTNTTFNVTVDPAVAVTR